MQLFEKIGPIGNILLFGLNVAKPINEGIAANQQAKRDAAIIERQARDEAVASSINAERRRRQNRQIIAQQQAGQAQSGALSGSTLDLLDSNSVALELDALTVEYGGELRSNSLKDRAARVRADGKRALTGGFLGAVGAGVSAAGQMFNQFDPLNFESDFAGPNFAGPAGSQGIY